MKKITRYISPVIPEKGYMEPFKIFGNLYFVGNYYVSSHIIDTGDGLILIDSGFTQCLYLITEGMRKLGLDPMNIKYILHSHGHYDHIAGTNALVAMTGAKTIIGRGDVDFVNGKLDLTWADELGFDFHEAFEPDIIIDDGDIITCGKTKIRAVSTPGHTPGTMSFFFNVDDGETTYTAAMFGGIGVAAMTNEFLDCYGLDRSCRDDFLNSIEKMRKEKADILIGNHPQNVDTEGKYRIMQEKNINPFIDDSALDRLLDEVTNNFNEMIKSGL